MQNWCIIQLEYSKTKHGTQMITTSINSYGSHSNQTHQLNHYQYQHIIFNGYIATRKCIQSRLGLFLHNSWRMQRCNPLSKQKLNVLSAAFYLSPSTAVQVEKHRQRIQHIDCCHRRNMAARNAVCQFLLSTLFHSFCTRSSFIVIFQKHFELAGGGHHFIGSFIKTSSFIPPHFNVVRL